MCANANHLPEQPFVPSQQQQPQQHKPPQQQTMEQQQPSFSRPVSILKSSQQRDQQSSLSVKKHVKGLWNDTSSPFGQYLTDGQVQHVFSFLEPRDLCCCERVSPRWRSVATEKELWETIDLTSFVACTYQHFCAQNASCQQDPPEQRTAQAVVAKLAQYSSSIRSLSIRSINDQLSADFFTVPCPKLQHLLLEGFSQLTDTHVHALLFLAASKNASKRRCLTSLKTIRLLNCPRLTVQATWRSMAHFCPQLDFAIINDVHCTNNNKVQKNSATPSSPKSIIVHSAVDQQHPGAFALVNLFSPPEQ